MDTVIAERFPAIKIIETDTVSDTISAVTEMMFEIKLSHHDVTVLFIKSVHFSRISSSCKMPRIKSSYFIDALDMIVIVLQSQHEPWRTIPHTLVYTSSLIYATGSTDVITKNRYVSSRALGVESTIPYLVDAEFKRNLKPIDKPYEIML